ncbi:MAG: ATP-binding protein [Gammaproteobacteria bacterium]|nr:ATP-binding protein [Gammaproteobacteria bacterium]
MLDYFLDKSSTVNSETQRKIWREQVRLVEESSSASNIASLLLAVLVAISLWDKTDKWLVAVWFICMVLVSLLRLALAFYNKKIIGTEKSHDLVNRWFILSTLLTAAGWGVIAYLSFPVAGINQLVIGFSVAGIIAGGVPVLAPLIRLYYSYMLLVLVPFSLRLGESGPDYNLLVAITVFFGIVMAMSARRINKSIMSTLDLRFHNESLIRFMEDARNQSDDLNEELASEIISRKRIEKELKKARKEAELASGAKGEFLANMSHEIRTPMNGVLGMLELLKASALDDEQEKLVTVAYESGDSLLTILNDILDFSKIEAGKLELENKAFDLQKLVSNIVVLMSNRADERNVELVTDIDARVSQRIKGDAIRLSQILSNLVSNAVKFTENGKVTINVSVVESGAGCCRILFEVIDTGIGIPAAVQKKLFSSFTQADNSTTRKYGGTGLGLSIVKQLVTLMQGRLGLDSEPGKGSRFWFEIEFETVADVVGKAVVPERAIENEMLQGKVLLVEDNPVNQLVSSKMLEKMGLEYVVVANGEEAIQSIAEHGDYDIVLMDCHMPVMDGFEASMRIRQNENANFKDITIIAMTANVLEGDREKCIAAGMNDYIPKPVKMADLKQMLYHWLNK